MVSIVLVSGCTGVSGSNIVTYENNEYGISFDYNSSWKMTGGDGEMYIVSIHSPKESPVDSFSENFNVVAEDVSGSGWSVDKYTNVSMKYVEQSIIEDSTRSNYSLINVEDKKIDGLPARKVTYFVNLKERKYKFMQVFLVKDKIGFVLTFVAPFDKYDEFKSEINTFISSFEFI